HHQARTSIDIHPLTSQLPSYIALRKAMTDPSISDFSSSPPVGWSSIELDASKPYSAQIWWDHQFWRVTSFPKPTGSSVATNQLVSADGSSFDFLVPGFATVPMGER
ncbi:MAG: hypothetical protein Q9157_001259, partial [Trypethelium eluteriae]